MLNKLIRVGNVKIIGAGLGFASQVVLIRLVGASEYGEYVYIFSWVILLSLLGRFGYDNYLIRKLPEYKKDQNWAKYKGLIKFSRIKVLLLSLSIGGIALIFFLLLKGDKYDSESLFIAFLILLPVVSLSYLGQSTLVALKKVTIANIPIVVVRHIVMIMLMLATVLLLGIDFFKVALGIHVINLISFSIVLVMLSLWASKYLPSEVKKVTSDSSDWKSSFKASFPFLVFASSGILNQRTDIITLGFFESSADIGIYSAVTKVLLFIILASQVANITVKPYISTYLVEKKFELLKHTLFKASVFTTLASFAMAVVLVFFGRDVLSVFGQEFTEGYLVLIVLVAGKLVAVSTGPVGALLMMSDNQHKASGIELSMAGFNIVLNLILIPFFGLMGAAVATAVTWILRNLLMLSVVWKNLRLNPTIFNYYEYRYHFNKLR